MDLLPLILIGLSLLFGSILLIVSIIGYLKHKELSIYLLLCGVVLLVLPYASSMKLSTDGFEVTTRDELLVTRARLSKQVDIAKRSLVTSESKQLSIGLLNQLDVSQQPVALVFYKNDNGLALEVSLALKAKGFLSTMTNTDFSELGVTRLRLLTSDSYVMYTAEHRLEAIEARDVLRTLGLKDIRLLEVQHVTGTIQVGLL